ncbi:P-loop containing nucleoside triphosphate hydrolase protein [Thelephora ganbajun]|uniref:P-loop containing nucleoside triphosphate hydrolase protein n=1 Tax=Thelephora ganbajun TaxID=370292 RepID=A0ACB6ZFZ5_THEGA|nr:P-loop containing nucleoside triphosphate hydrolase protein [Thelephora ganbajun]
MDLDLDGFGVSFDIVDDPSVGEDIVADGFEDAQSALRYIDDHWYRERNRRGRQMDLIGDYAGTEPFVLDGEALLQEVLDDPLLAIAHPSDVSYQILHAKYLLERLLENFVTRSANFDIVFFQATRHLTQKTGDTTWVVCSRRLARRQLFNHLTTHLRSVSMVFCFSGPEDPKWVRYLSDRRPMFVMTNDGGPISDDEIRVGPALCQRAFIFDVMARSIPIALLHGASFRDSKIVTFIFEQGLLLESRVVLGRQFWACVEKSHSHLEMLEQQTNYGNPVSPLGPRRKDCSSREGLWTHFQRAVGEVKYPGLSRCFMLHCEALPLIPLRNRTVGSQGCNPHLDAHLRGDFLPQVFSLIDSYLSEWNLDLDLDGNIFIALLRTILSNTTSSLPQGVGDLLSRITISLPLPDDPSHMKTLRSKFPVKASRSKPRPLAATPTNLLPFRHDVFDEGFSLINLPSDDSGEIIEYGALEFGRDTAFNDKYHWHNARQHILPKHLGGEQAKPSNEWQRMKMLRGQQRFMARLTINAATLTGALGARFSRLTIVTERTNVAQGKHSGNPVKGNKKQGKKEKPMSSKEKLLAEIAAKKLKRDEDGQQEWWESRLEDLSGFDLDKKLRTLAALERNPRTSGGWLQDEVLLYRLHLTISKWISQTNDQETSAVRDHYTVAIMRIVKELSESKHLTLTIHRVISTVLTVLGFEGFVTPPTDSQLDRPLCFGFVKLVRSKSGRPLYEFMHITEDPITWQLRLFGEFMDRSMGSKADPRVSFAPDAWQREVLDCLDRNESILAVAPTSAGKTFISFYAMEQVLRTSDDGVLVYIAPTKALVTQVAAEIYARFSKDVKNGSLWAIHTRDYRINDPQRCQILVTVPEMLSIMMLSPPLARTWLPRMKRIILDEIHTIGQESGGATWEQILLLAPCPIIGLSATVGDPEKFNSWLASVQKSHGFKHTFIHHPHRYSHLRKFYYLIRGPPEAIVTFEGLSKHISSERMRFLHPISVLSFGSRTLPPDLALEARDTLMLYQALEEMPNTLTAEERERLRPLNFFSSSRPLRQEDVLGYESELKRVVGTLMDTTEAEADGDPPLLDVTKRLTDPHIARVGNAQLNMLPDRKEFLQNLVGLLCDLHVQGDLPALLFSFDRTTCEEAVYSLVAELEEAEDQWRTTSPEWTEKMRAYESWKAGAKQREKQRERAARQRPIEGDGPQNLASETSWEASFDPSEPSKDFSFAGNYVNVSKEDVDNEIARLAKWSGVDPRAFAALKRGIGIHHAGMNKTYRALVESWFRQGYLRVVVATGTLALGINAPTKTSVFMGDSPFLTALMYRQCAGRAGRRGYDLLGKVVFYGISFDRVQRIILSRLPSLAGQFPLTSTLVLRLLNLMHGADSAPATVKAVRSLLQMPQVIWDSREGEHQLLHHLRFSIEYLRRARLVDGKGRPMNLFGIAAHLYYTEPSNLALVTLLRAGVIHKICSDKSMIQAKQNLLILFCHLFGRRELPPIYTSKENLEAILRLTKSASKVILPPLNRKARNVLVEHEKQIREIFTSCAATFADHNSAHLGEDDELPLSKLKYAGSRDGVGGAFQRYLEQNSTPVVVRSLFVANSGHGDVIHSISELAATSRSGIHFNEHATPSMERFITSREGHKGGFALNAYIYDFYMHGQVSTLAAANGIRRGDIWYLLDDFILSLTTVRSAIEQLLTKASKEAEDDLEDEILGIDSGFGEPDEDGTQGNAPTFSRPRGVTDRDWRVYEVLDEMLRELHEKFKTIWA